MEAHNLQNNTLQSRLHYNSALPSWYRAKTWELKNCWTIKVFFHQTLIRNNQKKNCISIWIGPITNGYKRKPADNTTQKCNLLLLGKTAGQSSKKCFRKIWRIGSQALQWDIYQHIHWNIFKKLTTNSSVFEKGWVANMQCHQLTMEEWICNF